MSQDDDRVEATTAYDDHILVYARNVASAGLLARARPSAIRDLPLTPALMEACGRPPADARKLRDGELIAAVTSAASAAGPPRAATADELTERNLDVLGQVLELDESSRALLRFLLAVRQVWELRSMLSAIPCRGHASGVHIAATALGVSRIQVDRALAPTSRLTAAGFVHVDRGCDDFDDFLTLDGRIADLLTDLELARDRILDRFLPVAPPPTVGALDFPAIGKELALATRLLSAAIARGVRGVNILIHGTTGAGKTELARLLARDAGGTLYVAGRDDGHGNSPDASERLTSLRLGQRALANTGALLLFDELEDLFMRDTVGRVAGREKRDVAQMSKLWFNQTLEETPVPTIWISNDVSAVDPAYLRRFAFALELRAPSRAQRRRLWARHLGGDLAPAASDRDALAAKFPMSPAQIEMAARMARLLGDVGRDTLETLVTPVATLVAAPGQRARSIPTSGYDARLASSPTDLAVLADELASLPATAPGVSLCLYGPPGTGKSEYVRHLAHRMGRQVVVRRCSDILSMWVGGTERQLADAFREASEEGAVLLFDEADSFLRDRRLAQQSWEITHTNEFLQQLDEFTGVVACTTNLVEDLDQACLRRFVFKLRFDYLQPTHIRRLFDVLLRELGAEPASLRSDDPALERVTRIDRLTPGDFAAVKRRLSALRVPMSPARLAAELEAEVHLKEGRAPRLAGFATTSLLMRR